LLQPQKPVEQDWAMRVHFVSQGYSVIFTRAGRLLAAKSYYYQNHADVAYQLLALCQLYQAPVSEVRLLLNGWLTEDSPLYQDLRRFFDKLSFEYNDKTESGYPEHFFQLFPVLQKL
jgi:hypothetical protein